MKRLGVIIFNFFLLAVSSTLAWGAAEKAEALEKKADLTRLAGLNYFFASSYNDNMLALCHHGHHDHGCGRPTHRRGD